MECKNAAVDETPCPDISCGDLCVNRLRTMHPCVCTCNQIFVQAGPPATTGALAQDVDGGETCICVDADDHHSIDPTTYTNSVILSWNLSTIPPAEHPLAISATTCPNNPGFSFEFFAAFAGSAQLICPCTFADWTGVVVLGTLVIENPNDVDSDEIAIGPPVDGTYPDLLDCDPGRLPIFYACRIRDLCGNFLSLCILNWSPGEHVTCPVCVPGPCCSISISTDPTKSFSTACDPDTGEINAYITVLIVCGMGCFGGTHHGTGTVEFTMPDSTIETVPFDGNNGDTVTVHTTSGTHFCGPGGVFAHTVFTWDDVTSNCPPAVNCPASYDCASQQQINVQMAIGGGIIT